LTTSATYFTRLFETVDSRIRQLSIDSLQMKREKCSAKFTNRRLSYFLRRILASISMEIRENRWIALWAYELRPYQLKQLTVIKRVISKLYKLLINENEETYNLGGQYMFHFIYKSSFHFICKSCFIFFSLSFPFFFWLLFNLSRLLCKHFRACIVMHSRILIRKSRQSC